MSNSNHKELLEFCRHHNVRYEIRNEKLSYTVFDEYGLASNSGTVIEDDYDEGCGHILKILRAIYNEPEPKDLRELPGRLKNYKDESWEEKFRVLADKHDVSYRWVCFNGGLLYHPGYGLNIWQDSEQYASDFGGDTKDECYQKAYEWLLAHYMERKAVESSWEQKLRDYCEGHCFRLEIEERNFERYVGRIWINDISMRTFKSKESKEISCRATLSLLEDCGYLYEENDKAC